MKIPWTRAAAAIGALALVTSVLPPSVAGPAAGEPGQGVTARVLLESREGVVETRPLRDFHTRDPRKLGAHLVRFEGLDRGRSTAGERQGHEGRSGQPSASGRPAADPNSSKGVDPAGDEDLAVVSLHNGDLVRGEVLGGEGEELGFMLLGDLKLAIPVDDVASLVFPGRIPTDGGGSIGPASEGDRLYRLRRTHLDQMDGTVEEFTAEGVKFNVEEFTKFLAWNEVAALFVEPFAALVDDGGDDHGGSAPETTGQGEDVRVIVDLANRSRLRGELIELSARGCKLQTVFGQELELPIWSVAEVAVDDGSLAFLSDLEPDATVEGSPFDDDKGMQWPHRRDRSVTGGPLRAGGRYFTRGIGVHAPSELIWQLDGEWKQLRGLVAIDDEVRYLPRQGSVIFRVHVDGEQRWESPLIRGGDAPLVIPAQSLEGARELRLEVDMATEFFIADRADWLRLLVSR